VPHLHRLAGLFIACAVAIGLLAPHDQRAERAQAREPVVTGHPLSGGAPDARGTVKARATSASPSRAPQAVPTVSSARARSVQANELGQVPILMYHRILKKSVTPYDRSPEELRAELERLAKDAYVPVTATEYATGRINIPAGTHPVVLTFDDGYPSHLNLDAQGNPKADTAVGIIQDVARRYPWFRPVATFYLIKDPFMMGGKASEGVRWLVAHGSEVANHTHSHVGLSGMPRAKVEREIGADQKMIADLGGGAATTLAFPNGAEPTHLAWADHGKGAGASWDFAGMFLAGWRPADSPFSTNFDPMEIPRVRSEDKIKMDDCKQFCSTAWLDWLDKNPGKRYTSDGDPAAISFPSTDTGSLAKRYDKQARTY
jgi:peptidoglycan/xylan/chitin deacetylase (PgdA/CDA1 family)